MKRKVVTFSHVGAKVVRGPDWIYFNEDKYSEYGIITDNKTAANNWCVVKWMFKTGDYLRSNYYRIGELEDDGLKYDLCYYEQYELEDPYIVSNLIEKKLDSAFESWNINLITTGAGHS
jgi:hypothetical protein